MKLILVLVLFLNRVLHSLTEALKSSGVNMSETMISVQLSLRKRADREYSVTAFASEVCLEHFYIGRKKVHYSESDV